MEAKSPEKTMMKLALRAEKMDAPLTPARKNEVQQDQGRDQGPLKVSHPVNFAVQVLVGGRDVALVVHRKRTCCMTYPLWFAMAK